MERARLGREVGEFSSVVVVERGAVRERVVNVALRPGEDGRAMLSRAVRLATQGGATVLCQEVFGLTAETRSEFVRETAASWPVLARRRGRVGVGRHAGVVPPGRDAGASRCRRFRRGARVGGVGRALVPAG